MKRFDLYMPEPMLKKLQDLAREQDISAAELVRKAVETYLMRNVGWLPDGWEKKYGRVEVKEGESK